MKIPIVLLMLAVTSVASAQTSIKFQTSVSTSYTPTDAPLPAARDFWFAPLVTNSDTSPLSYIVSILCSQSSTAFVQVGTGAVQRYSVRPDSSISVVLDRNDVHHSSDSVRRNAVHIWCDSADLVVSLANFGGDIGCIHSSLVCDTLYAVVAPSGKPKVDTGFGIGEFSITSFSDSTIVSVLPSSDIMHGTQCLTLGHAQGKSFTVTLQLGQSIMYTAMCGGSGSHDLSGTVIHSNHPIAVVAGSSTGAIEMLTPVSTWGKKYYLSGGGITVIGTKDNQVIRGYSTQDGASTPCTLGKAFDVCNPYVQYVNRVDSDDPFCVIQYSIQFSVAVPAERYAKTIRFTSTPSAIPFDEQTTPVFIVNAKASYATLDGRPISQYGSLSTVSIDGYKIYTSPWNYYYARAHLFASDSPACIIFKGNYAGQNFSLAPSPDLLTTNIEKRGAPTIAFSQNINCLTANIRQTGVGIGSIVIDSIQNATSYFSKPFRYADTACSITFCITDSLKAAHATIRASDLAGNASTATIRYTPNPRLLNPGLSAQIPLDTCLVGTSKVLEFSLVDTSLLAITVDNIFTDDNAFVYDRTWPQNKLPFTLIPGEPRTLSLKFGPQDVKRYDAHLLLHSQATGNVTVPISGIGYTLPPESVQSSEQADQPIVSVANGQFRVHANGTFELVNVLGETVMTSFITGSASMDCKSLAAGVYVYRISTAGHVVTGKITLP